MAMATLVVREPGCVAYTVELADGFGVGRDPENQLALTDRQASRRHARFSAAGDGYRVVDLGSTHGTLVNGVRASDHQLADGDEIQVGKFRLVFFVAPG